MTEKFSEKRIEQSGFASRCTDQTRWRVVHRLEDEYRIVSILGKGASACVVAAQPLATVDATKKRATVALKIYANASPSAIFHNPNTADALPCEVSVLQAIFHTIGHQHNIVALLDFFEWKPRIEEQQDISSPILKRLSFRAGCSYKVVVLEHVAGTAVETSIEKQKKFCSSVPTPALVIRGILTSMLRALSALHALGMAHRDIKPANIIRRKNSLSAVLVDYGFAACRAFEKDASEPLSMCRRPFAGSPLFISPEFAAKCEARNDAAAAAALSSSTSSLLPPIVPSIDEAMASDVWAAALTVMCLRNGSFPHPQCTSRTELFRSFHSYRGPPKILIAEDASLNSVLRKMLKRDWRKRITACVALQELYFVPEEDATENSVVVECSQEEDEPDQLWHSAIPRLQSVPDSFQVDNSIDVSKEECDATRNNDSDFGAEEIVSLKRRKT